MSRKEKKSSSNSSSRNDDNREEIEFTTSDGVNVLPSFDAMSLKDDLLRGIYAYGKCFKGVLVHYIHFGMSFIIIYSFPFQALKDLLLFNKELLNQ